MTLSGDVLVLQGLVNDIQDAIVYLNQQLLLRPDLPAFSQFNTTWNQQYSLLADSITNLNQDIETVNFTIANLLLDIDRIVYVTGLSGLFVLTGFLEAVEAGRPTVTETFETLSKNLSVYPYEMFYTGASQDLDYIQYLVGTETIWKRFSYDESAILTGITISGSTGISFFTGPLFKYFYYSGGSLLTGISYAS